MSGWAIGSLVVYDVLCHGNGLVSHLLTTPIRTQF